MVKSHEHQATTDHRGDAACQALRQGDKAVVALDGLDLVAPTGQVTAVLGPNGAGKTTFVRAVATLHRPTSGTLRVAGIDAIADPQRVRQAIGLAGQYAAVEARAHRPREPRDGRPLFGHDSRRRPAGRRQRPRPARPRRTRPTGSCAATRAACAAASTSAPASSARPACCCSTSRRPASTRAAASSCGTPSACSSPPGTDVLLTTQYLEEADQLADHVVIIDHGRAIATGTPGELKSRAGRDRVEIRVRHHADLAAAAEVLAGLGDEEPAVDEPNRRVAVGVERGTKRLSDADPRPRRRRHRHRRRRPAPPDARRGVPRAHRQARRRTAARRNAHAPDRSPAHVSQATSR